VDAIKALLNVADTDTDVDGDDFDLSNYTAIQGVNGTSGDDLITGTSGDDRIKGNDGDDYINAGDGKDWWVKGGAGNDIFEFGEGANVLALAANEWEFGADRIRLTGQNDDGSTWTFADLEYDQSWSEPRGDVMWTTEDGDRLIIRDATIDQFSSDDFI